MKDALRRRIRHYLKTLDDGASRPICLNFAEQGLIPAPKTVLSYLCHGGEINSDGLNAHYIAQGLIVAAPKVSGDRMAFHQIIYAQGPFIAGAFGIREPPPDAPRIFPPEPTPPEHPPHSAPAELAFPVLILIPGLAFARNGDRLGKGAGYYDRFLTEFLAAYPGRRAEITLAGACHEFQIVDRVPTESHDIPVDCLLTERNAILCMEEQHG